MASFVPVQVTNGRRTVTADTPSQYNQYLWEGYWVVGTAPPSPPRNEPWISRDGASPGNIPILQPDGTLAFGAGGGGSGGGGSGLTLGLTSTQAKPGNWKPTAVDITDSTGTGRSLLTAADAAAARSTIGAGTSSLILGTNGATAKAGDWKPAAVDITDSTPTGRSVLTAADAAAARTVLGVGSSSLTLGLTSTQAKPGDWKPTAADVTDSTATGRSVVTAADSAAARTAIGAGTSSLALGTTGTTAKAGDWKPTAADVTDSTATGRSVVTAATAAAARNAIGAVFGNGITEIQKLTQAAYDALGTKDAATLYVIVG